MRGVRVLIGACLLALLAQGRATVPSAGPAVPFPGWPATLDGESLEREPLSERERRFHAPFPCRVARFRLGGARLVLRWVSAPTPVLHPAEVCFRGVGYEVRPAPGLVDERGREWGCLLASRDGRTWRVRERITGADGRAWTDVSAWFWSAWSGRARGPWWSWLVAEPLPFSPDSEAVPQSDV